MHSLNHIAYAKVVAAERAEPSARAQAGFGRHRPPPRHAAAHIAARLARRLDADVARRAVA